MHPDTQTHTQIQRVLDLAHQKGMLRPCDLQGIGVPRVVLTRLVAAGQLEKLARGLYHLPGAQFSESGSLIMIAAKVPQAVFCLLTALQFHELTTQMPRQIWISMPRGSHVPQIDYPPTKMVQFGGEAYSTGIEIHHCDQTSIRVYSAAKTVADCFKHRHKIGLDVAIEALRDARAQKKASADDLWRFAKICRVANVMRPYLEVIG
jgi:predicted transcriptional regulator of viral defense system